MKKYLTIFALVSAMNMGWLATAAQAQGVGRPPAGAGEGGRPAAGGSGFSHDAPPPGPFEALLAPPMAPGMETGGRGASPFQPEGPPNSGMGGGFGSGK